MWSADSPQKDETSTYPRCIPLLRVWADRHLLGNPLCAVVIPGMEGTPKINTSSPNGLLCPKFAVIGGAPIGVTCRSQPGGQQPYAAPRCPPNHCITTPATHFPQVGEVSSSRKIYNTLLPWFVLEQAILKIGTPPLHCMTLLSRLQVKTTHIERFAPRSATRPGLLRQRKSVFDNVGARTLKVDRGGTPVAFCRGNPKRVRRRCFVGRGVLNWCPQKLPRTSVAQTKNQFQLPMRLEEMSLCHGMVPSPADWGHLRGVASATAAYFMSLQTSQWREQVIPAWLAHEEWPLQHCCPAMTHAHFLHKNLSLSLALWNERASFRPVGAIPLMHVTLRVALWLTHHRNAISNQQLLHWLLMGKMSQFHGAPRKHYRTQLWEAGEKEALYRVCIWLIVGRFLRIEPDALSLPAIVVVVAPSIRIVVVIYQHVHDFETHKCGLYIPYSCEISKTTAHFTILRPRLCMAPYLKCSILVTGVCHLRDGEVGARFWGKYQR